LIQSDNNRKQGDRVSFFCFPTFFAIAQAKLPLVIVLALSTRLQAMYEKEEFTGTKVDRREGQIEIGRPKKTRSKLEKLFESDWEVLVVERDGQTGEFRARISKELSSTD